MRDFLHLLDQVLLDRGRPAAEVDPDGIIEFELAPGVIFCASIDDDERCEFFGGLGYASAETLRTLIQGEEEFEETGAYTADAVTWSAWSDAEADWDVEVLVGDGLVILTRESDMPSEIEQMQALIDELVHEHAHWSPRVTTEPLVDALAALTPRALPGDSVLPG